LKVFRHCFIAQLTDCTAKVSTQKQLKAKIEPMHSRQPHLTAKKSTFKLSAPLKSHSTHSAHEKKIASPPGHPYNSCSRPGSGCPPPSTGSATGSTTGPAPPRGMLLFEAAPIDQFQHHRAIPSNKKARNTMDSITCKRKSRRACE